MPLSVSKCYIHIEDCEVLLTTNPHILIYIYIPSVKMPLEQKTENCSM